MCTLTACFSAHALLLQIPGAEVTVYRVKDPVRGDDPGEFDDGVLESPVITEKVSCEEGPCEWRLPHHLVEEVLEVAVSTEKVSGYVAKMIAAAFWCTGVSGGLGAANMVWRPATYISSRSRGRLVGHWGHIGSTAGVLECHGGMLQVPVITGRDGCQTVSG